MRSRFQTQAEAPMRHLGRFLGACLVVLSPWAVSVYAQTRSCPPGFNDTPAMSVHFDHASVLKIVPRPDLRRGTADLCHQLQRLRWRGTPGTSGAGAPRTPDPVLRPRFTRVSAPDSTPAPDVTISHGPAAPEILSPTGLCSLKQPIRSPRSFLMTIQQHVAGAEHSRHVWVGADGDAGT